MQHIITKYFGGPGASPRTIHFYWHCIFRCKQVKRLRKQAKTRLGNTLVVACFPYKSKQNARQNARQNASALTHVHALPQGHLNEKSPWTLMYSNCLVCGWRVRQERGNDCNVSPFSHFHSFSSMYSCQNQNKKISVDLTPVLVLLGVAGSPHKNSRGRSAFEKSSQGEPGSHWMSSAYIWQCIHVTCML